MWHLCLLVLATAESDPFAFQQASLPDIIELADQLADLDWRYQSLSTLHTSLHDSVQQLHSAIDSVHEAFDATETETFEYNPAEDVLKRLKKLAGDIAVFETQVVYHHDDEMYDKIDATVNALADSKERLQRLMQTVEHEISELESLIRKEKRFYWSYVLTAVLGFSVLCSCCAMSPRVKLEPEENEP